MSEISIERFFQNTLPDTETTICENESDTYICVRLFTVVNTTSNVVTVSLYNIPFASDASGSVMTNSISNINLFWRFSLASLTCETKEFCSPGVVLKNNCDSIKGESSVAAGVVISAFGFKETL